MTVEAAHDDLLAVILWIDGHFNDLNIPGDDRSLIAAACFDMVLEHQASIALQVQHEMNGTALSILRLQGEALMRGMWFARCATHEEATRFKRNDEIRKLTKLVAEIEIALGGATDTLSKMVREQWGRLCDFAHTGYQQVTRRYTGAALKPKLAAKRSVEQWASELLSSRGMARDAPLYWDIGLRIIFSKTAAAKQLNT